MNICRLNNDGTISLIETRDDGLFYWLTNERISLSKSLVDNRGAYYTSLQKALAERDRRAV